MHEFTKVNIKNRITSCNITGTTSETKYRCTWHKNDNKEEDMNTTAQWYETELKQQGWSLEQRSQQANGVVLSYSRERELMTVGLLRHQDKTQVLVNRMDR